MKDFFVSWARYTMFSLLGAAGVVLVCWALSSLGHL